MLNKHIGACTQNTSQTYFYSSLCFTVIITVILAEGRKGASQTAKITSTKKIDSGKHWAAEHKQCCQEDWAK